MMDLCVTLVLMVNRREVLSVCIKLFFGGVGAWGWIRDCIQQVDVTTRRGPRELAYMVIHVCGAYSLGIKCYGAS